jgi:hypothetical protein
MDWGAAVGNPGNRVPVQAPDFQPGGRNNEFYTNQFQGLLNQQANFRNQQDQARAIRQASNEATGGRDLSWDWLEGGLPDRSQPAQPTQPTQPTAPIYPIMPTYPGSYYPYAGGAIGGTPGGVIDQLK